MKKRILAFAAAISVLFAMPINAFAESGAESAASIESIAESEAAGESIAESAAADESIAESAAAGESAEESAETDAVTSASVNDFYTDFALSGDELMDAVNSFSGFYAVSTVNEDGTPQLGYFVYSMLKDGDTYYLMLGLEKNQTRSNLERTGTATAMYAVRPDDEAQPQYAVSGARMDLELVTDEELIAKLNESGYDTAMFCVVTAVSSLG